MRTIQIKVDELSLARFDEMSAEMCSEEDVSMTTMRSHAFDVMLGNYDLVQRKLDEQVSISKKLVEALEAANVKISELLNQVESLKGMEEQSESLKSQLKRISEAHEMLEEKYDSASYRLQKKTEFNDSLMTSMLHILNEREG